MRPSLTIVACALLASAGCEPGGYEVSYSVSDSLGIQNVTVDTRHQGRSFRVHEEPEWPIGDGEGVQFHGIEDAVLLENGRLAVADGSQQQVIVIDPRVDALWGALERTSGSS